MAYTPINWQTGQTITAEKLNKMDNGWSVDSTRQTLCQDTVTTETEEGMNLAVGSFPDSAGITATSVIVTLDGVEYNCPQNSDIPGYGDVTFTDYPFAIDCYEGLLVTPSAGTYTVKIEADSRTVEVSQNFIDVVAFHAVLEVTTFQEVLDAMSAGRIVVVQGEGAMEIVCGTDTLDTPLQVFAVGANANGVYTSTYVASSVDDDIHLPF